MIGELIRALADRVEVTMVVGDQRSVSEGFLRPGELRYSEQDGWATVEGKNWHLHFRLDAVDRVEFEEQPSHCLGGKLSYAVQWRDREGKAVLGAYLSNTYDAAGRADDGKVAVFRELQARFANGGQGPEVGGRG